MTSTTSPVTAAEAALARLSDVVGQIGDGDLHRAHRDGGWSVAGVVSHVNVCTLIWIGSVTRLANDPELRFFFREEVGHDAVGYPPPTVALAQGQLASTRRSIATCLPAVPPEVLARSVEIPDLGTLTVAEWTPLIIGHLTGHVDQALDILRDRGVAFGEA
jgi:DinB superfamily